VKQQEAAALLSPSDACDLKTAVNRILSRVKELEGGYDDENYPAKSALELKNEDLQRENDCASDEIVRLSKMIVELGFDPSVKKKKL
jgi:hypothetical protein